MSTPARHPQRIAVFGTGGVGGYFGGRLAEAGRDVVFVARGAHLDAMRAGGLTIESPLGNARVAPVKANDDPAAIGVVDVILVGVKAWQVESAAAAMRPLVGPTTTILPLQNGVEAPAQLARALGREHVLGGLCRTVSMIAAPGVIRHMGADPWVGFGELDNRRTPRVAALLQLFDGLHGVTAENPADIGIAMWNKFAFICAVSGVGAVTRAPIGVMRTVPQSRRMIEDVLFEVAAVARARKVDLPRDTESKLLAFIDTLPADATASMQRDIMDGRPSELEAQCGAVVRFGLEAGVPVPVNAFIYHSLLPGELMARGAIAPASG